MTTIIRGSPASGSGCLNTIVSTCGSGCCKISSFRSTSCNYTVYTIASSTLTINSCTGPTTINTIVTCCCSRCYTIYSEVLRTCSVLVTEELIPLIMTVELVLAPLLFTFRIPPVELALRAVVVEVKFKP